MSRRRFGSSLSVMLSWLALTACTRDVPVPSACRTGFCIAKTDLVPAEFGDGGTGRATDEPIWVATTSLVTPLPDGVTLAPEFAAPRRIRWEVTEQFLIARDVTDPVAPFETPPAYAAYRIESHIDPTQPSRGTCFDCFEETPSAPWYQRPYVRIDWSMDLVELHFASTAGAVVASPFPLFVNNPADPNAPRFECGGSTCGSFTDAGGPLTLVRVTDRTSVVVRGGADSDAGDGGDASADAAAVIEAEVTFRTEYVRQP